MMNMMEGMRRGMELISILIILFLGLEIAALVNTWKPDRRKLDGQAR